MTWLYLGLFLIGVVVSVLNLIITYQERDKSRREFGELRNDVEALRLRSKEG